MTYFDESYKDDTLYHKIQRSRYVRHVNEWLSKPFYNNSLSDEPITNGTMAKRFFDELNDSIQSSGFMINDNKQFKEDFIHIMYTLSKL